MTVFLEETNRARYLAIDGGNSKTDVLIGDDTGQVLGYARGPGTCHQNIGLDETMARLRSLVAQARRQAGPRAVVRADVFLAGADLPAEVELLTRAVAAEQWSADLALENDTFALLRAGTDAPDAVAVVCGAGINCVGRTGDGRTARFPSLGRLSGDWGGGGHLSWLALWHAVRGEDGRGPATDLTRAVAEHFGLPTAEAVGAAMHLQELEPARLAELSPVLFTVAEAGDRVAGEVVDRQAQEIVSLATVAARRLGLLDAPFVVVLGGGVLRARPPRLHTAVVDGIHALAPKASITVVDAPPVLGAALSALDALGATPAAHEVVRAALAALPPATRAASGR
ncbi:MAG: N-acetylglucosamine kinase [Micromonosporaceae bacterium]